jgi:hypothetical protein
MNCETCLQTKPIPVCISEIVIGQITAVNTAVVIKIKNEATGRIVLLTATSSNTGIVTVDVSDILFMEAHYTFTIHPASDYSNDYEITIGSDQSKCVDVSFENCNEEITSATLELND